MRIHWNWGYRIFRQNQINTDLLCSWRSLVLEVIFDAPTALRKEKRRNGLQEMARMILLNRRKHCFFWNMGVSQNRGTPKISHWKGRSILGYPHLWKQLYLYIYDHIIWLSILGYPKSIYIGNPHMILGWLGIPQWSHLTLTEHAGRGQPGRWT